MSRWRFFGVDPGMVSILAGEFRLTEPMARLLAARGIRSVEEAHRFFRKSPHDLKNPFDLNGMDRAVRRIFSAIRENERILVHGDFDADGITSTALLVRVLRSFGASVSAFVPNRLLEGHGISRRAIQMAKESAVSLVITCDCGSSSNAEIQTLNEMGIDTIVTDHHEVHGSLPSTAILVNPKEEDDHSGQDELSGVGVAFLLCTALRKHLREGGHFEGRKEPNLRDELDIVALGTLADMAPLRGQNRILVAEGLDVLAKSQKPGVLALKEVANLSTAQRLGAQDVSFRLAPRINASARLGHSDAALELLTTDDLKVARTLAESMEGWNQERKALQEKMTRLASRDADEQVAQGRASVVVSSSEFHSGVIGLVAQKLAEKYSRPVFVFASEGNLMKGSARSRGGVDLSEALSRSAHLLEGFGGHKEAAGCTLEAGYFIDFMEFFEAEIRRQGVDALREVFVDAELNLGHLNEEMMECLSRFEPFGVGNAEPLFSARAHVVGAAREVGRDHLRMSLREGTSTRIVSAVGFGMWSSCRSECRGEVEILYTPESNVWNGRRNVQLRLKDVKSV